MRAAIAPGWNTIVLLAINGLGVDPGLLRRLRLLAVTGLVRHCERSSGAQRRSMREAIQRRVKTAIPARTIPP